MMDNKVKCRKCLLRDKYPEDYEKYVAIILRKMNPKEKVSDERYNARLGICRQCEKLQNGTCIACGCMVEIRAIQVNGKCPYRYW